MPLSPAIALLLSEISSTLNDLFASQITSRVEREHSPLILITSRVEREHLPLIWLHRTLRCAVQSFYTCGIMYKYIPRVPNTRYWRDATGYHVMLMFSFSMAVIMSAHQKDQGHLQVTFSQVTFPRAPQPSYYIVLMHDADELPIAPHHDVLWLSGCVDFEEFDGLELKAFSFEVKMAVARASLVPASTVQGHLLSSYHPCSLTHLHLSRLVDAVYEFNHMLMATAVVATSWNHVVATSWNPGYSSPILVRHQPMSRTSTGLLPCA